MNPNIDENNLDLPTCDDSYPILIKTTSNYYKMNFDFDSLLVKYCIFRLKTY